MDKRVKKRIRRPVAAPNIVAPLARLPHTVIEDDSLLESGLLCDIDLSDQSGSDVKFKNLHVKQVKLSETRFDRLEVIDTIFEGCDLSNADWSNSLFNRVQFIGCRLTGLRVNVAMLRDVQFDGCKGDLAQFRMTRFQHCHIKECMVRSADFQAAVLSGLVFTNCNLQNVQMSQADLKGTDFTTSSIEGLQVNPEAMKGMKVSPYQAACLAVNLGLDVCWEG